MNSIGTDFQVAHYFNRYSTRSNAEGLTTPTGFFYTKEIKRSAKGDYYLWRCAKRRLKDCDAYFKTGIDMMYFAVGDTHHLCVGNQQTRDQRISDLIPGQQAQPSRLPAQPFGSLGSPPSKAISKKKQKNPKRKVQYSETSSDGGLYPEERLSDLMEQVDIIDAMQAETRKAKKAEKINTEAINLNNSNLRPPMNINNQSNQDEDDDLILVNANRESAESRLTTESLEYDEAYQSTKPNFRQSQWLQSKCKKAQTKMNQIIQNNNSKLTDFAHTHLFDIKTARKFLAPQNISILNETNCFVDSMLLTKSEDSQLNNEGFVYAMQSEAMKNGLDIAIIFTSNTKVLIYHKIKTMYSALLRNQIQAILKVAATYDFQLHNIDIATDFKACFALDDHKQFIQQMHKNHYSDLKKNQLSADYHSFTAQNGSNFREKFYNKTVETLLISSVRQSVGGLHRYLDLIQQGYVGEDVTISRFEKSYFKELPTVKQVESNFTQNANKIISFLSSCYKVAAYDIWNQFWKEIKSVFVCLQPSKAWIIYGTNNYQGKHGSKLVGINLKVKLYNDDLLWSFTNMFLPFSKVAECYRIYDDSKYDHYQAKQKQPNVLKLSTRYSMLLPSPQTNVHRLSKSLLGNSNYQFQLTDAYYSWRNIPSMAIHNSLDIQTISSVGENVRMQLQINEISYQLQQIEKRKTITTTPYPEEWHVDGAKFSRHDKMLTLYDIANYQKYQLDFGQEYNAHKEIWESIQSIYAQYIDSTTDKDGNIMSELVAFHPLSRPVITYSLLAKKVSVSGKCVYSYLPQIQGPTEPPSNIGLKRTIPKKWVDFIVEKNKGGQPHFGLSKVSSIIYKNSRSVVAQIDLSREQVIIPTDDIIYHSKNTIELKGQLFSHKYDKDGNQIRVYQRRDCKDCKVQYHKKKKKWTATTKHFRVCKVI